MAGVTILGSEVVMMEHPLFLTFGTAGVSLLIIALILGIIFRNDKQELGLKFMVTFGILGTIIAFGGMGWAGINKVEDYVKYDVSSGLAASLAAVSSMARTILTSATSVMGACRRFGVRTCTTSGLTSSSILL